MGQESGIQKQSGIAETMAMVRSDTFSFLSSALACFCFFAAIATSAPAHADDPFDLESSSWMSFDRYKDKPAAWVATHKDPGEGPVIMPVIVPTPVLPPAREVALPAMPGLNKDAPPKVTSTADDADTDGAHLTNFENQPDLQLSGKNWLDAADMARQAEEKKKSGDAEHSALDVRLSYLPDSHVAPADLKHKVVHHVVPKVATVQPTAPAATPAANPALCAALDSYKKHQLQAIESDRKTLTALQSAIAELGLKKQLSFLADTGGHLNIQSPDAPAMDLPAASPGNPKD